MMLNLITEYEIIINLFIIQFDTKNIFHNNINKMDDNSNESSRLINAKDFENIKYDRFTEDE
jgi:hypothetical protein